MPIQRPGQTHAVCKLGGESAPIEAFVGRWRKMPNGPVWHYNPSCRFHEETERHQAKAENLALHILHSRADSLARATGTTRNFILNDPRGPLWIDLLPQLNAFLEKHARCVNCHRTFDGTPDIQFDHIHPPRRRDDGVDWHRHCARNIRILCGSCNNGKRQKDDALWIDEQYEWQLLDADRRERPMAESIIEQRPRQQLSLELTVQTPV
jgi:hypothetical protein